MQFFRRILNFDEKTVVREEQRLARRMPIPDDPPMKARLEVSGLEYAVKLRDLSTLGCRFEVELFLDLHVGLKSQLFLDVDGSRLALNGRIARMSESDTATTVGMDLSDNAYPQRRALVQLLEPIATGATFTAIPVEAVPQPEPGLTTTRFAAVTGATLTVWRSIADGTLAGFEFHGWDFYIRSSDTPPDLRIYREDKAQGEQSIGFRNPTLAPSTDGHAEVHRFFDWVVIHLSADLPADLRAFLQRYRRTQPTTH